MFRLMDEINFFEIVCLYIVMFQTSPAAPSCGQSGHSRRNKSTLLEGTKMLRTARLQTRTAHRPEATETFTEEYRNALNYDIEHLTASHARKS